MLTRRIIPCLDVQDGRIVKGVRFSNLRDAGDPVQQAVEYERQGADELIMLDVSATHENRMTAIDTVRSIRAVLSIPLTVGGGIQGIEGALELLRTGADRVAINTAAVIRPELIRALAKSVGRQCVVVAIDAAQFADRPNQWEVVTHSGRTRTGSCAVEWARNCEQLGTGEILLTSWDRDGTRTGYDLQLIAAVRNAVDLPLIASGGASSPEHMAEAFAVGADAVLAASIFHESDCTVTELKSYLTTIGLEMRS